MFNYAFLEVLDAILLRGSFQGAARALHLGAVAALAALGPVLGLSVWYYAGLLIVAAILAYEHRLVKPDDLSRINRAFFDMNAVIGMVFLAAAAAGVML